MRWFLAALCFVIGALLSAVAAYVSVYGMMILFGAHALVVGIMIGSIEAGKLVASVWLKTHWSDGFAPFLHKAYLVAAVVTCMFITGLGVYGFLSAAHLEQANEGITTTYQAQNLERQIEQKKGEAGRIQERIALLDKNVAVFLDNDKASQGLAASRRLQGERDELQSTLDSVYNEINGLNAKLIPLKADSNAVEAKLGPVKYVAALVGVQDEEVAVRFIILLIIVVFDPLAIMLMISGLISLRSQSPEVKSNEPECTDDGGVEILPISDEVVFTEPSAPFESEPVEEEVITDTPDEISGYDEAAEDLIAAAIENDLKAQRLVGDDWCFEPIDDQVVDDTSFEVEEEIERVLNEPLPEIRDIEEALAEMRGRIEEEVSKVSEKNVESYHMVNELTEKVSDLEKEAEEDIASENPEEHSDQENGLDVFIELLQREPNLRSKLEQVIEELASEKAAQKISEDQGPKEIFGGAHPVKETIHPGMDRD